MIFQFNVKGTMTEVDQDTYEKYVHLQHLMRLHKGYVLVGRLGRLHRLIMDAPENMQVDHINHNPLDNRRENLRLATPSQNNANQRKRPGSSSQYRGVYLVKKRHGEKVYEYWVAKVKKDRRIIFEKSFKDEVEAAKAYDAAALQHYGDYANINFPESTIQK